MKLYRFAGQAEKFPGCGLLPISHTVTGNLTELKKFANIWRQKSRKDKLRHKVYIETIYLNKIDQKLLMEVLSREDTSLLVERCSNLKTWEWNNV